MSAPESPQSSRPLIDINSGKTVAKGKRPSGGTMGISPKTPFYQEIDPQEARQEKIRKELIKRVDDELKQKEPPLGHAVAAKAYNEILADDVHLHPDFEYHDVINQLHGKGHMWNRDDDLTKAYVESAIERAKLSRDEWAYREISGLGIEVTPDDSTESIYKKLKEKGETWNEHDPATHSYINEAIDFTKKPKKEELPRIAKEDETRREEELPQVVDDEGTIKGVYEQRHPDIVRLEGKTKDEFLNAQRAFNEITHQLHVTITPDDTRDSLLAKLPHWEAHNPVTQTYVDSAIEFSNAERARVTTTRFVMPELYPDNSASIYLGAEARKVLNIDDSSTPIRVVSGEREYLVTVQDAIARDHGELEDIDASYLRMSQHVLEELNIARGSAVIPVYDADAKEIRLTSAEYKNSPIKVSREPREILAQEADEDTFFVTATDKKQLGLEGNKAELKFGKIVRPVNLVEVDEGDKDKTQGWQLSKGLVEELGIPRETVTRLKVNSTEATPTIELGPSLGVISFIKHEGEGVKVNSETFSTLSKLAREYGVFACAIDPDSQDPEVVAKGFCDAYVFRDGSLRKARVPMPSVSHDRKVGYRNEVGWAVMSQFEHAVVPGIEKAKTGDKLGFAQMLDRNGLKEYHPETIGMKATNADQLASFVDKHSEILLKPQYGAGANGQVLVLKSEEGYIIREFAPRDENNRLQFLDTPVSSSDELLEMLQSLPLVQKSGGLEKYIAQDKIKFAKYKYQDPMIKDSMEGGVELRMVLQRGIDGKIRVGSGIAKLLHDRGDAHKARIMTVLEGLYPGKAQEKWDEVTTVMFSAQEAMEQEGHAEMNEVTYEIAINEEGKPIIIEANALGSNYRYLLYNVDGKLDALDLRNGRYNLPAGPLEYSLYATGMS